MAYSGSAGKTLTSQIRLAAGGVISSTLSGNVTLDGRSANVLQYDPGGSSRNITFPAEDDWGNALFIVENAASDAGELLALKDDAGATKLSLDKGEVGLMWCNGTAWFGTALRRTGAISGDTIAELTAAAGVTIDGLLIKDGYVAAADNQGLKLGNTAAAPDITIAWDGTRLNVTQGTANSEIRWGVDGAGLDQVWYTDTASESFTLDQSAGAVVMTANVAITGQGSTVAPVIPIAAPQALSGSGAVNITSYYTSWDTTGGGAGTLANGAQKGQIKKIQLIVDGGDGTLTPTSLSGGTTITFADAGDFALLCWNGTAWVAIELGNDADGATAPVLA